MADERYHEGQHERTATSREKQHK